MTPGRATLLAIRGEVTFQHVNGADGIDGGSSAAWSINNAGTVSSSQRYAISLHSAGDSIVNSGSISGYSGSGGYGVDLGAGGSVINTSAGYITGGEDAIFGSGAAVTINNSGQIVSTFDDGIGLFGGGSVTNNAGAMIQAPTSGGFGPAGIYVPGAPPISSTTAPSADNTACISA